MAVMEVGDARAQRGRVRVGDNVIVGEVIALGRRIMAAHRV